MNKLSRRKRKILWTALLLASTFLVASLTIWYTQSTSSGASVKEKVITSKLDRNIPEDLPPIRFQEVTGKSGIDFKHFFGRRGSRITEDMGSGAAWIDYNDDGYQDLFIVNISGSMDLNREEFMNSPATTKLYRNNGDGTFSDVTEQSGLKLRMYGMGTAWADIDNNGTIDCLVTGYKELRLFSNNGDGTFTEITDEAGLNIVDGFWAGAVWSDVNNDAYLDLYVTGYISYFEIPELDELKDLHEPPSINPSVFEPIGNLLFINRGDGTFEEHSAEFGVQNQEGKGLEASWVDLSGDGLNELYVTNDVSDNVLYQRVGTDKFSNISYQAKVADYRGSMGLAVGDWDKDLDFDLFITHWVAEENALYTNLSSDNRVSYPQTFKDEADRYGLGQSSLDFVGWGTFFFDFDNDSRLDLFVANGHTNQQRKNPERLIGMKDLLYWNRNNEEGFYEIGELAGEYFSREYVGRGAAYSDYNNDGRLDLFVVNHDGPGILLENQTETGFHWLKVSLEGSKSNCSAIGTKLTLYVDQQVQVQQVGMQASYLSQNSLVQHFGLHDAVMADSLKIEWPSGQIDRLYSIEGDRHIRVKEGEGTYRIHNSEDKVE